MGSSSPTSSSFPSSASPDTSCCSRYASLPPFLPVPPSARALTRACSLIGAGPVHAHDTPRLPTHAGGPAARRVCVVCVACCRCCVLRQSSPRAHGLQSLAKVKQLADKVNDYKREVENSTKVLTIQQSISGKLPVARPSAPSPLYFASRV